MHVVLYRIMPELRGGRGARALSDLRAPFHCFRSNDNCCGHPVGTGGHYCGSMIEWNKRSLLMTCSKQ